MKDTEKRRLQRFWGNRILLAVGAIGTLSGAMLRVPAVLEQHAEFREVERREVLSSYRKQEIQRSITRLQHQDSNVRSSAAYALGELQAKEAIPQLISLLQDQNSDVRISATIALGKLQVKEAIPQLISLLQDQNSDVRRSAAEALDALINLNELSDTPKPTAQRRLMLESLLLTSLAAAAIAFLASSVRLSNPYPMSWSGHLILPEEMMAELITLYKRRLRQKQPLWRIRLELTYEIVLLIWAVHILTRIQNLGLPNNRID